VILGNLPPVTRIRYVVNGDVGAGPSVDSFRATVDLSGVDPEAGSTFRTVSVTSLDPRFFVIDYEPRGINVQLDPYKTYTVPVIVNTGPTPPDIEIGKPALSQETVSVSGPDSVVKYVVAAQADVTIDPHGLSVDREVPLIAVDNLGKALTPVRVDPPTVHVTIPVFSNAQTKTLPVHVNVVGTPPTGYVVDSVTVDPSRCR
jgi:YbbR domain-containing protein